MPDDVLWRVPFEALPVDDGFLGDRTTIVYAGSATSLYHAAIRASRIGHAAAACRCGAGCPCTHTRSSASHRTRVDVRPPDSTGAEVRSIASVFDDPPAAILTGEAATESAVRAQAAGASIVHIAAPFRMNGASPLFSAILLSAEGSAGQRARGDRQSTASWKFVN